MHATSVMPIKRDKGHSEVITHLQIPSLLPGTNGPHAIFVLDRIFNRHASAGFLSIDRF